MTTPENTNINSAATRGVASATGSIHEAIDRASTAVHPAVDRVSAGAHHAVDSLAGAASHAAESLDARTTQLRDAESRLVQTCRTQMRDQPFLTLGIAVASGFALSWLLRQR
jgi:ElaB/YqjD/DUF883 family membrane-anchored ribosome-binding protein